MSRKTTERNLRVTYLENFKFQKIITSFKKSVFHYPTYGMILTLELEPHRKSLSVILSLNSIRWSHYCVTLPPNHLQTTLSSLHTLLIPEYRRKISFPLLDTGHWMALYKVIKGLGNTGWMATVGNMWTGWLLSVMIPSTCSKPHGSSSNKIPEPGRGDPPWLTKCRSLPYLFCHFIFCFIPQARAINKSKLLITWLSYLSLPFLVTNYLSLKNSCDKSVRPGSNTFGNYYRWQQQKIKSFPLLDNFWK